MDGSGGGQTGIDWPQVGKPQLVSGDDPGVDRLVERKFTPRGARFFYWRVVTVVTGSLNFRSARCGRSIRSQ